MSEQQISGQSGDHADPGTPDVSETTEQGDGVFSEGTVSGDVEVVQPDEADAEATDDKPSSYAPQEADDIDDDEAERREANRNAKPTWDVRTHGSLDEDDPRRERYTVVGE